MMVPARPWLIYIAVVGSLTYHELSLSSVQAVPTYNFFANQRPRFQIPHGNLSYYRSPQWEVLYYLKFGVFPFYSSSSPYLNRTEYLNRIRLIKSLVDGKNGGGSDEHDSNSSEGYNEMAHNLRTTANPESFTPLNIVGENHSNKPSRNYYYPMAQLKKNTYQPQQLGKLRREDKDKRKQGYEYAADAPTPHKGPANNLDDVAATEPLGMDYFLVDGDPTWFKQRYAKHAEAGIFSDDLDGGSVLPGMDHGGMTAEMTIERKVGRKFHTQGWK